MCQVCTLPAPCLGLQFKGHLLMVFPSEPLSPVASTAQSAKALRLLNNVPSLPVWGFSMAMRGDVY